MTVPAMCTDTPLKHFSDIYSRAAAAQTLTVGAWTKDLMSNNEEEPPYGRIYS